MASPILRLPLEVLEKIVLELHDDPKAPPTAILPLLLTSKYFSNTLGFRTNSHLYARFFRRCFDSTAPARRLGDLNAFGFSDQLRANFDALRSIRRRDIHATDVLPTFWTAFSMLMENDGKNRSLLDDAGLPDFVGAFVRHRLYENNLDGWPADNEINALALWLVWLTTTEERLKAQTAPQRAQMVKLVLPFVIMPVRYAAYLAPHTHYTLPLSHNPSQLSHSFVTAHGHYLHYRDNFARIIPLHHINAFKLGIPLASAAAKLIYFAHRETSPVGIPPHLPRTRAEVGTSSQVGPTQEDIEELNNHKAAKFVPNSSWEWWSQITDYDSLGPEARSMLAPSARWDDDWNRLADCTNISTPVSLKRTHYTPGFLCGLWQGRMLYPDENLHADLIQMHQMPPTFGEQSVNLIFTPVFMRLREYHCMDVEPNRPAPSGSIQNAWFHSSTRLQEETHGLTVTCEDGDTRYHEYVAGGPDLHIESQCRGCEDRGTSEMIFREHDERYLSLLDDTLASEGVDVVEDDKDDAMDDDAEPDMAVDEELVIRRKCNGILDIVLVGETDFRHGQAWQHYKFYGRVREWDGLVALIRVPIPGQNATALGVWVFTGYVVGGQNLVGNWRTIGHPGEPVPFEGAFAMSKRE